MFKILSMTLKTLYIDEKLDKNLYDFLKKPKASHRKNKKALTHDELEKYFKTLKGHRLEHLVLLMFATGLRCGEACALKWSDVVITSESCGYVVVNKTVSRIGKKIVVSTPKTEESNRKVFFNDKRLVDCLLQAKERIKGEWLAPSSHTDYPINPVLVSNYYFKEMSHKARIQEITSHYARVTYASYALEKGLSIKNLQKQLGHANSILIHTVYAKAIGNREEQVNSIDLYD